MAQASIFSGSRLVAEEPLPSAEKTEGEVDLLNEEFGFRIFPLLEHGSTWGASLGHDLACGPGPGPSLF